MYTDEKIFKYLVYFMSKIEIYFPVHEIYSILIFSFIKSCILANKNNRSEREKEKDEKTICFIRCSNMFWEILTVNNFRFQ